MVLRVIAVRTSLAICEERGKIGDPLSPQAPMTRLPTPLLISLLAFAGCSSNDAVLAAYATAVVDVRDRVEILEAEVALLTEASPLTAEVTGPLALAPWATAGCSTWEESFDSADATQAWGCRVEAPSEWCLEEHGAMMGIVVGEDEGSQTLTVVCH